MRDAVRDPRRRRRPRPPRHRRARPLALLRCSARTAPRRPSTTRSATSSTTCSGTSPSSTSTSGSSRSRRCSRSGSRRGASTRPRARSRPASLALVAWLVLEVAAFASQQSERIEERNMFYVAPLALRPAARARGRRRRDDAPRASLLRRPPRSRRCCRSSSRSRASSRRARSRTRSRCCRGGGCRITACTLDEPPLGRARRPGSCACGAASCSCRAGSRSSCPRSSARTSSRPRSWSRTGATGSTAPRSARSGRASASRTPTGSTAPSATTPRSTTSGAATAREYSIWENEFFNRSFRRVYNLAGPAADPLPEIPVARRADGELVADGTVVRAQYVLADGSTDIGGVTVARDPAIGLRALPRRRPGRDPEPRHGPLPERHLVGPDASPTARVDCDGGPARGHARAATRRSSRDRPGRDARP